MNLKFTATSKLYNNPHYVTIKNSKKEKPEEEFESSKCQFV